MFGVGMPELMIIFVIALLVFGPKELPKIAKTLGKAMAELRRASDDLRDGIQREIDNATREEPETPPVTPEPVASAESIPVAPSATAEEGVTTPTDAPEDVTAGEANQQVAEAAAQAASAETGEGAPTAVQLTIPIITGEPSNGRGAPADSVEAPAPADAPTDAAPKIETAPPPPVQPAGTRNA
jgi:Tat protein translocase TatB subunit